MKNNIEELTLLLLYLTSWNDNGFAYNEETKKVEEANLKTSWKGYQFDVLNELVYGGYLYESYYKNKTITLTPKGIELAKKLAQKYLKN